MAIKKRAQTRSSLIIRAVSRRPRTINEILKAVKAPTTDQKYFASVALRMVEAGQLKRRQKDGVWVYRAA